MSSYTLQTMKHFVHLISQRIVLIVHRIPILPSSKQSVGTSTLQTSRAYLDSGAATVRSKKITIYMWNSAVFSICMCHNVLYIDHIDKCSDSLLNWCFFCVHSFDLVHQNCYQKQSKYNYHSFMSCDWCQWSDKTFSHLE